MKVWNRSSSNSSLKTGWQKGIAILLFFTHFLAMAEAPLEKNSPPPPEPLQTNWVFSGTVTNENGERYHYYFEIQKKDHKLMGLATLIASNNNEVILNKKYTAEVEKTESTHWQVGRLFLRFDPITNSWIFGVKNKNHKGFNFKVDMLSLPTKELPKKQDLSSGLELLVTQTGILNGHIQAGSEHKEQFVTAQRSWFKQIWVYKPQWTAHPLRGVFCEFNDGSTFYAIHLQEPKALRGAIASWHNKEGEAVATSQFVTVKENKEGQWFIHIPSPKINLQMENILKHDENNRLIAGLTKENPGFCAISQDAMRENI